MLIPSKADVVIIGGGIMGLCTAYYLACRGLNRIIVLEGASDFGGQATKMGGGGFRFQFSSQAHIQLSLFSLQLLQDLEHEVDMTIPFHHTGYLFVITDQQAAEEGKQAIELQRRLGVMSDWLTPEEIHKRFPMLHLEGVVGATWHANDGWIVPRQIAECYLTLAIRKGVRFFPSTSILALQVADGAIQRVLTNRGSVTTGIVINAAGTGAGEISQMVGCRLPLTYVRHQICMLSPEFPVDIPTVIFPQEEIGFRYNGSHLVLGTTDRIGDQQSSDSELVNRLLALSAYRMPALSSTLRCECLTGIYDLTPDGHAILGRIPLLKGFYCITGFNGHGFMHAPAYSFLLSEEIADGHVHTLDTHSFQVNRFF